MKPCLPLVVIVAAAMLDAEKNCPIPFTIELIRNATDVKQLYLDGTKADHLTLAHQCLDTLPARVFENRRFENITVSSDKGSNQ